MVKIASTYYSLTYHNCLGFFPSDSMHLVLKTRTALFGPFLLLSVFNSFHKTARKLYQMRVEVWPVLAWPTLGPCAFERCLF